MIDQVVLGKGSIDRWVEDRDALLRDPRGHLRANPVRILGMRLQGLLLSSAAILAMAWGISPASVLLVSLASHAALVIVTPMSTL